MPTTPPIKVPILGVDKYTKEFNAFTKKAHELGRNIGAVGAAMTRYVTLPLAAGGIASMKFARDLNQSMANVGTMLPGQTERLKKMKVEVMDLAVKTGISTEDIAEGLYETIGAFGAFDRYGRDKDPMGKLAIASTMARAGVTGVKESVYLLSAVMKGYGLETDAAAQSVSDMAFKTVDLGQTSFAELASALTSSVPLANAMKWSMKELFGVFATATGITGTANEVSTQIASLAGEFLKPTAAMDQAAKHATKFGAAMDFSSAMEMGSVLGIAKSLDILKAASKGNESVFSKMFGRKEATNLAMILTGTQMEAFGWKTEEVGKALEATLKAFKAQTGGINEAGFTWDQGVQRTKNMAVVLGDKLLPQVEKFVKWLEPLIDRISNASDATLTFGLKAAGAALVMGPLISGIGKIVYIAPGIVKAYNFIIPAISAYVKKLAAANAATMYFEGESWKMTRAMRGSTASAKELARINPSAAIGTMNANLKSSVKEFGYLNAAVGVLAAGFAGWTIGTVIYDQLIKPLMRAHNIAAKVDDDLNFMKKAGGASKLTTDSQKNLAAKIKGQIAYEEGRDAFRHEGMGVFRYDDVREKRIKKLRRALGEVTANIEQEEALGAARKRGITDTGGGQSVYGASESQYDELLLYKMSQAQESKIEVTFKGLPPGTTAEATASKGGKVKVKNRGPVMEGAF
jgi:TP901 family phage tail tape measure protein